MPWPFDRPLEIVGEIQLLVEIRPNGDCKPWPPDGLQTLAAGWPMGYQAYSSWMYSYTDHQTTPTFVHLQATLGCTGGRRCHVTFSAGTFKPPRCTPGDRQWLYVQSSVGNIVQSCNPRYSIFFDYMAIHREVLTPDHVSFMEFLGFLQRTDLSYIKNFVSDALGTTSIQTPWIDDNPSTETAQAWNAGFLRGRKGNMSKVLPVKRGKKVRTRRAMEMMKIFLV